MKKEMDMYECAECHTVFGLQITGLEVRYPKCPAADCNSKDVKTLDTVVIDRK